MAVRGGLALFACLALTFPVGPAVAAAGDAPAAAHHATLTRGSRLLVEARVDGHPLQALLDSAAETSFIDLTLARALKLTGSEVVKGVGSGESSFDTRLIKHVRLEAFGLTLPDQTIATADLQDVGRRLLGQRLDFILGREIFDAARLRIDVEAATITVLDRRSTPPGVRLELVEEHGLETVPARVEGDGPLRATFDLGNGSEVLVSTRLAERLHLLSDGRPVQLRRGGGLGGETERKVFTLRSLELGGRVFHDVVAAVDAQPNASDLNVGMTVLHAFIVTSDFAQRAVWLEPRAGIPAH